MRAAAAEKVIPSEISWKAARKEKNGEKKKEPHQKGHGQNRKQTTTFGTAAGEWPPRSRMRVHAD